MEVAVRVSAFNNPGERPIIGNLSLGDIQFVQGRAGYAPDDPRRWVRHRVSDFVTTLNEGELASFFWAVHGTDIITDAQRLAR
jgi:hypothetical protein